MYNTIHIESEVNLPYFPEETTMKKEDMSWQSKQGLGVGQSYKITNDGRLKRKEQKYREKTRSEKQQEAEQWGFESWDDYVKAYENPSSSSTMYPKEIDYNPDSDENSPPVMPQERTIENTWWADHNMHGSFEFHGMVKENPIQSDEIGDTEYELDVFLQYEARFTKGDLDEIVFVGERMSDESREETIERIKEWNKQSK